VGTEKGLTRTMNDAALGPGQATVCRDVNHFIAWPCGQNKDAVGRARLGGDAYGSIQVGDSRADALPGLAAVGAAPQTAALIVDAGCHVDDCPGEPGVGRKGERVDCGLHRRVQRLATRLGYLWHGFGWGY